MLQLGKQPSTDTVFKIIKGMPVPFNVVIDASNLLNNVVRRFYYSVLQISLIGIGISVLLMLGYYYLSRYFTTTALNLYSASFIFILGPCIMLSAIGYHYLNRLLVRLGPNKSVGHVLALSDSENPQESRRYKSSLISVVYKQQVYLMVGYKSKLEFVEGDRVLISFRPGNAKYCWIHKAYR